MTRVTRYIMHVFMKIIFVLVQLCTLKNVFPTKHGTFLLDAAGRFFLTFVSLRVFLCMIRVNDARRMLTLISIIDIFKKLNDEQICVYIQNKYINLITLCRKNYGNELIRRSLHLEKLMQIYVRSNSVHTRTYIWCKKNALMSFDVRTLWCKNALM